MRVTPESSMAEGGRLGEPLPRSGRRMGERSRSRHVLMHYGTVSCDSDLKDEHYPHQDAIPLSSPQHACEIHQPTERQQSVGYDIGEGCRIVAQAGADSIYPDNNATHLDNTIEKAVVYFI